MKKFSPKFCRQTFFTVQHLMDTPFKQLGLYFHKAFMSINKRLIKNSGGAYVSHRCISQEIFNNEDNRDLLLLNRQVMITFAYLHIQKLV
jgi:hypothetical protein